MVWYVALIAVLNIGLGYALAVYFGAGRGRKLSPAALTEASSDDEADGDGDEYYSDDDYGDGVEESEYETAGVG